MPNQKTYNLFWSAARRLDTGHKQIERVRESLNSMPPLGSPAGRQHLHEILGDAEMAIWAIDKALEITLSLAGRYEIEVTVPATLREKQPLVGRLRDHYSHIDERALGRIKGKPDATANEALDIAALVLHPAFMDGRDDSLDIDTETTNLCIEMRDYLVKAWTTLTATER